MATSWFCGLNKVSFPSGLLSPRISLIGIFTLLAGCSPSSYMGISLRPGEAPAAVQRLALEARAGDKQAQFCLGRRFDTGAGVPLDPRRAAQLNRLAKTVERRRVWVYRPSVGTSVPGEAVPVDRISNPAVLSELDCGK